MARVGTVLVALGVFALGLPAAAEAPQTDGLTAGAPASQPAPAGDVDDNSAASSPVATTDNDSDEVSASSQPAAAAASADAASAGAAEAPASMPGASAAASQPASSAASQPASSAASQPASSAASQPASRPAAAEVPQASEDIVPAGEDQATGRAEPSGVSSSPNVLPAEMKERRLVAFVAAGVATVALGAGIALGVVAQQRYQCLSDVVACNQTLEEPIVGDAFLEARAEVENLSLLADMSYVLAAGSALVAVTSFVRGFMLPVELEEVTP